MDSMQSSEVMDADSEAEPRPTPMYEPPKLAAESALFKHNWVIAVLGLCLITVATLDNLLFPEALPIEFALGGLSLVAIGLWLREWRYRRRTKQIEAVGWARYAELQRDVTRYETANLAKSQFLALTAQELRTPLVGLAAACEVDDPYINHMRGRLTNLGMSLDHTLEAMLKLLDQVLDYAASESTPRCHEAADIDLFSLIRDTCLALRLPMVDRCVQLEFNWDPTLPAGFVADPMTVRQLFFNFISYCVRFSAYSTVRISIRQSDERASADMLPIRFQFDCESHTVWDGIAPVLRNTREQRHYSNGYGPSFIIMQIQDLLRDLGSELHATESGPRGVSIVFDLRSRRSTVFGAPPSTIRIARAKEKIEGPEDTRQALAEIFQRPPNEAGEQRYALVVDDNNLNRIIARRLLESRGFGVDEAAHGGEAARLCQRRRYDIVLMDVLMPVVDGYAATRKIRQTCPRNRQPRILAVTASRHPRERQRCMEAGMDACMFKPIRTEELDTALRKLGLDPIPRTAKSTSNGRRALLTAPAWQRATGSD